ncbi:hypothetical protein E5K53_06965 [Helicobacter pylori]|uniref:hypothetical protein n=1 Tax=Helicobacter pylori TaxID=210 RepID=UPI000574B7FB|nr:hypothetical protein [Helicobacter pylori]KHL82146.1 hypothetical protein HPY1846_05135 [Helicobacter pylori]MCQ2824343.1 hypothetical protein [Helicobacter pylori]MDU9771900.1 hypothetical protein [Helicobacter pylori]PUD53305.1 hypothetical protein C2R66_00270 [Helicobacter pylori]WRB45910.1 hypothetical protein KVM96_06860 [Helicobacter pylori]
MKKDKSNVGYNYRNANDNYQGLHGTAALLKEMSDLGGPNKFIAKYGPRINGIVEELLKLDKLYKKVSGDVNKFLLDLVDDHTPDKKK